MSLSQCGLCSSQFSRPEHLRRHLRSHENTRPYKCSLCQRSFTRRRDAKTRHGRTCRLQPTSGQSSENANADIPREPNPELGLSSWFEDDILTSMLGPSDFAALDWLYSPRMSSDSIIAAERLDFLAYFTSENGMGTFLAPKTLKQRQGVILHDDTAKTSAASDPLVSQTINPSMLHINSEDIDPLTAKTFKIIHDLHAISSRKTDNHTVELVWTAELQSLCHSFFSPLNITRLLGYFWSLWYPNCPIVHRASFCAQSASPPLLCAMILIGACLSPHLNDASTGRIWLDCVEELAFDDRPSPEAGDSFPDPGCITEWKRKRLEQLQTAYLVCSLQKREGSLEARARIRRHRHATMVMLARDTGISTASHRNLNLKGSSETRWQQFVVEEGLIRTMTYVFLFDAACTIFHNSPPRMVVSELKMEMACPEACFQAQSAEECFAALKQWESTIFWQCHLPIVSVVKGICQHDLTPESVNEYSKLGSLNLFTVVQCLHSLTFHLQNSIIFESTLLPIKTGLENWRRIWNKLDAEDESMSNHADTLWKQSGFTSYSPEFWHLARIIVDKIGDDNADLVIDGARMRYDHTDMTDVNGLIMEYRRMSLGATG